MLRDGVVVVHVAGAHEAGGAEFCGVGVGGELGEAFAVGDGDGEDAAFHAGEEDAGALLYLEGGDAGFEAFGFVLHEARPGVGAGDDAVEVAHHLAAVAHAEGKAVFAGEEGGEFVAGAGIEECALGPAFTGSEDVAIAEATAGHEAAEIFQRNASADDVGHVDVHGLEAGAGEGGGHLDFAVHALLAEDRHGRANGGIGHKRRRRLKSDFRRQTGVGAVEAEGVLLLGAGRVVAEARDTAGDVGPDVAEGAEVLVEDFLAAALDAEGVVGVERADAADAGFQAVCAEDVGYVVEVVGADLDDGAEFFAEEGGERAVAGGNFEIHSGVAGEGHFDDGGE